MLYLHAKKKLLEGETVIWADAFTRPLAGQQLHGWYVRSMTSTFPDKMLMLYMHEPSLMSVVVRGGCIKTTYSTFLTRLGSLLHRFRFPDGFIATELGYAGERVGLAIANKDMLAHLNRLAEHVSYWSGMCRSYSLLDETILEDRIMANPYHGSDGNGYTNAIGYWELRLGFRYLVPIA